MKYARRGPPEGSRRASVGCREGAQRGVCNWGWRAARLVPTAPAPAATHLDPRVDGRAPRLSGNCARHGKGQLLPCQHGRQHKVLRVGRCRVVTRVVQALPVPVLLKPPASTTHPDARTHALGVCLRQAAAPRLRCAATTTHFVEPSSRTGVCASVRMIRSASAASSGAEPAASAMAAPRRKRPTRRRAIRRGRWARECWLMVRTPKLCGDFSGANPQRPVCCIICYCQLWAACTSGVR